MVPKLRKRVQPRCLYLKPSAHSDDWSRLLITASAARESSLFVLDRGGGDLRELGTGLHALAEERRVPTVVNVAGGDHHPAARAAAPPALQEPHHRGLLLGEGWPGAQEVVHLGRQ